jgi:hypothetical protein
MSDQIHIPVESVIPSAEAVLRAQGVPSSSIETRVRKLAEHAIDQVMKLAAPRGKLLSVSREEFEDVYKGEGRNDVENPLQIICDKAGTFALFAVTLGPGVSGAISRQFETGEFVDGAMLDAAASEATELAAAFMESWYREYLRQEGQLSESMGVLPFSPGYCGWHISGQKRLFERLKPETIGITLSHSILMNPLKSISGVLVSGEKEIFVFEDNYPFCTDCRTRSCQTRIRAVVEQLGDDWS